jgi:flagellar basal body-associated protein FliL
VRNKGTYNMPDDNDQPNRWRNDASSSRLVGAGRTSPGERPQIVFSRPSPQPTRPPESPVQPVVERVTPPQHASTPAATPSAYVHPTPPARLATPPAPTVQPAAPTTRPIPVAATPSHEPTTPAHRSKKPFSRKKRLLIIIVAAVIVVGVAIAFLASFIATATSGPVATANQFINAVQANDATTAYNLTSASFRQAATKAQLTSVIKDNLSVNLNGSEKLTAQKIATNSGFHQASVTYSVVNNGITHYMRVVLQEAGSKWQVVNFNSSIKPLAATIQ